MADCFYSQTLEGGYECTTSICANIDGNGICTSWNKLQGFEITKYTGGRYYWGLTDHRMYFATEPNDSQYQRYACTKKTTKFQNRIEGLQGAQLVEAYRNKMYFNLSLLHSNTGSDSQDDFYDVSDTDNNTNNNYWTLQNLISRTIATSATPTTSRYYALTKNTLIPKVKYRCQKSYIVVLSDGDVFSDSFSAVNDSYYGRLPPSGNAKNWAHSSSALGYMSSILNTKSFASELTKTRAKILECSGYDNKRSVYANSGYVYDCLWRGYFY